MPQRAINIILAVVGALIVLSLMLAGSDAYASARRGPKWWRRILGAGLAVLALLTASCSEPPPRTMCYKTAVIPSAQTSLHRLTEQLPLLRRLADSDELSAETVSVLLTKAEADLAVLTDEARLADLSPQELQEAAKLSAEAKKLIGGLRARMGSSDSQLSDEWRTVVDAWRFAEPFAQSGASTTKQRDRAKKWLDEACAAAATLADRGEMSRPEVKLLQREAARLRAEIYRAPPTDTLVECYDMMVLPPAQQSFDRLMKRLPLLRELAAEQKLSDVVLSRALPTIERDMETLSRPDEIKRARLDPQKVQELRAAVRSELDTIRKLLDNGSTRNVDPGRDAPMSLEESPQWQRTLRTWHEASEVAEGDRGPYPFDKDGKQELIQKLSAATDDVSALAVEGLMNLTEAALLGKELALLIQGVTAKRTREEKELTCYKPVLFTPERDSMKRLVERVPLLEQLTVSGAVSSAALEKIALGIERDVEALAEGEDIAKLLDGEREQALQLRDKAVKMLRALRDKADE